mmetsp:Transcript_6236/g.20488  ORF Transcript_6236/g.20488 Transcript_6236/m.20488 type:complete len:217 (-) Transcript_6236:1200-1850(-)
MQSPPPRPAKTRAVLPRPFPGQPPPQPLQLLLLRVRHARHPRVRRRPVLTHCPGHRGVTVQLRRLSARNAPRHVSATRRREPGSAAMQRPIRPSQPCRRSGRPGRRLLAKWLLLAAWHSQCRQAASSAGGRMRLHRVSRWGRRRPAGGSLTDRRSTAPSGLALRHRAAAQQRRTPARQHRRMTWDAASRCSRAIPPQGTPHMVASMEQAESPMRTL